MNKFSFISTMVFQLTVSSALAIGNANMSELEVLAQPAQPKAQQEIQYVYTTTEKVILKGILVDANAPSNAQATSVPQALFLPANTRFEIVDRFENEFGQFIDQVSFDTGDRQGTKLSYYVVESELVKSLYRSASTNASTEVALTFDTANPADAKFFYSSQQVVAGPVQFIVPIRNARRTSPPGLRLHPILKYCKFHAGTDYAAPTGTSVMAAADGIVTKATRDRGYGNIIYLAHGRLSTRYAHLSKILVRKGQRVKQGQVIGKVGSTGMSTGAHLHFEKRGAGGQVIEKTVDRCNGKTRVKRKRARRHH